MSLLHFSSEERAALSRLLSDPVLAKAISIATRQMRQPLGGMLAPEQLAALAMERGAADFVDRLERLSRPDSQPLAFTAPPSKSLHTPPTDKPKP